MKLSEHVDLLRHKIEAAFDKQFARLGIGAKKTIELEKLPTELHPKRQRLEEMLTNHIGETGDYESAREKLLDELTFTLFNRIAAVKVMESASLFPPIIIKQPEHGDRSFGHKAWLEERNDMRAEELEGIREYIKYAFNELGETLPLYQKDFPYALLPEAISLNEIIDAFNAIENDPQVEKELWKSDDILGWLYESYNNAKKAAFKESKAKTEYDKVSLQSQVYTPRWVVQFLVENSLGKLYLEMYPNSEIKDQYKIANPPQKQERDSKPLHEIKLIDPASGSGNFLLYAFDFFYALYLDQIENYGADYEEKDIPKWIIENNLHAIDLDDRAIQLAQLGLYIKARKKRRSIGNLKFKVISSDFYLPEYQEIKHIFEDGTQLDHPQKQLIAEIWSDLQYAYKFGSLIRLDEKLKSKLNVLIKKNTGEQLSLFSDDDIQDDPVQPDLFIEHDIREEQAFAATFFENLKTAVEQYTRTQKNTFLSSKTRDAIIFLELLTTKYDVATANPPYTDSADFGVELKTFIDNNFKKPDKFHSNLYATFIKRCYEFVGEHGFIAMLHPLTFMYIKTFEGVRKFILNNTAINVLVELGLGGVFENSDVQVDPVMYVLKRDVCRTDGLYFDLKKYKNNTNKPNIFKNAYKKYVSENQDTHAYMVDQNKLKLIKSWPFIYWISDDFRKKFKDNPLQDNAEVVSGMKTGNNDATLRFWWEIDKSLIRTEENSDGPWIYYAKGGPFKKWFGNIWLCLNWKNNGEAVLRQKNYNIIREDYFKRAGITYGARSAKGVSFRTLSQFHIFDMVSGGVFIDESKLFSTLGILNSKLIFFVSNCLNPTATTQPNDIKRLPLEGTSNSTISKLSSINVKIASSISKYNLVEPNFSTSPITHKNSNIKDEIKRILLIESHKYTQIALNEAAINSLVFDLYQITIEDKEVILAYEGESIGGFPICIDAKKAYLAEANVIGEFPLENILNFIETLSVNEETVDKREEIESKLSSLFQGNNDFEEFCTTHKVNPINVWYWFKESNVIPKQRMKDLTLEFLADMIREILMEDEDGIIPLVPNAGEKVLFDRIEEKFLEKGFSTAQYSSFDAVLGKPINDYLNSFFFIDLSEKLKLFKRLPPTPFIWHISSGPLQGFDCYIIIYKWSRDKLMRLKSVYIEHRERALVNRQSDLSANESAEAQNEKDLIFRQLKEIEVFKVKIDQLLEEGYNPILDGGVGKNIAPLQKKKMIPYEVLNSAQLKKYLNADW